MQKFNQYTTKLLDVYMANVPSMQSRVQIHFYEKMFRFTGEQAYLDLIKKVLKPEMEERLANLDKLSSINLSEINPSEIVRLTMRRNPLERKRIERRETYYRQHPMLKYYFVSLTNLQLFFDLQLQNGMYANAISKIYTQFQSHPWRENFFKKEHLLIHPVLFINSTYFLRELGVINFVEDSLNLAKDLFPETKLFVDELLYDQVYVYTHIIINETNFYQQSITKERVDKLEWIFQFFATHFYEIYQKVNLDLVLEILLCFKLAKVNIDPKIEQTIEEYMFTFFDTQRNCLISDSLATFEDMEHANVLLLMNLLMPSSFSRVKSPLF